MAAIGVTLPVVFVILVTLPAQQAQAACSPGAPVSNTTVTCSGTTTDQNAPDGYGTGVENNLTINVQSGATVSSTTNDAFNLNGAGTSNTINNYGTITGFNSGIQAVNATLILNNYGTITGTDPGVAGGISASTLILSNFGTITPAARLRYLATMLGGYTESGSTANLTVNSRTMQNIEERADLTLTRTISYAPAERIQTSATLGVLGLQRVGGSNVGGVLLGQNLTFAAPGKNSLTGVYGGLGLDWRTRGGVSFFSGGEYTAMSDTSTTITGKSGVRVTF